MVFGGNINTYLFKFVQINFKKNLGFNIYAKKKLTPGGRG